MDALTSGPEWMKRSSRKALPLLKKLELLVWKLGHIRTSTEMLFVDVKTTPCVLLAVDFSLFPSSATLVALMTERGPGQSDVLLLRERKD